MAVKRRIDLKAKKAQMDAAFAGSIRDLSWEQWKELGFIVAPIFLLLLLSVWVMTMFVQPAPPKTVVMTTGGELGGYHAFGKAYAESLKKSGIRLELRTSAGSLENIKRLKDPASNAMVGLLQGGVANGKDDAKGKDDVELVSLGRVFLEPLWIFYRAPQPIDRLTALKGQRIAVGPDGSGTRHLAMALLARNDIDAQNSSLLPLTGKAAVEAMKSGRADAVFLALAPEAPLVQELVRDPDVRLMSLSRAEAYTRVLPYLSKVVLPQGAFDLVRNIPDRDVQLVAPVAALVVRQSLHPAIVGLLVEAAKDTHAKGGLLHRVGEFPRQIDPEFEMSDDAIRYYKDGPSFLKRFLPFWLATFIERMVVLLVPVATLAIPVIKIGPALYKWRINRRLRYWYGQLKLLEQRISLDTERIELDEQDAALQQIERAVETLPIPVNHSQDYYDLRGAVDLVRQRLTSYRAVVAAA